MNISEAIKTLDGVIPSPDNKMVDFEHFPIAVAWKTVKAEIERLEAENAKRLNAIEDFTAKKCYLKCAIAKTLVKEFAEQLKAQSFSDDGWDCVYMPDIDDLLETYGLDGKVNGINLRLGVTKKDFEIITTALREYAKNHPNPKCHANEANDLAHLIEYQGQEVQNENEN